MHGQLALGCLVSLVNIALHAAVMGVVVIAARRASRVTASILPLGRLIVIMMATVAVLMTAHFAEVAIWAAVYELAGVVESYPLYFAFVNYTTLGYGDQLPSDQWRLIGPITAMNGILLFGWSTAVIFEVLRTTLGPRLSIHEHG